MQAARAARPSALMLALLALGTPLAGSSPEAPAPGSVETRLLLLGGGSHPPEAVSRFMAWAGGANARVLVVPWASGEPRESCAEMIQELRAARAPEVSCAPAPGLLPNGHARPLDAKASATFLEQLARATGVFFTGGDQARVMDVLVEPRLLAAVQTRFAAGVAFGGTSAGTAIMSPLMITGEGDFTVIDGAKVGTRPGLGLLSGVILDQHFVRRQRENRLFGLVLAHPGARGVGIDDGTALVVTGGHDAEVVGPGLVMLVDAIGEGRLEITLMRAGRRTDLRRRPGGVDRERTTFQ